MHNGTVYIYVLYSKSTTTTPNTTLFLGRVYHVLPPFANKLLSNYLQGKIIIAYWPPLNLCVIMVATVMGPGFL